MVAFVEDADAGEEGPGRQAVVDHLDDGAIDTHQGHREEAQGDEAHVTDRTVGDQPLHVGLGQRGQGPVDDPDDRDRYQGRGQCRRPEGGHRQVEPEEAVAADLQQDSGQKDRPGRRRLDVGQREPRMEREERHLDREPGEQEQEDQDLRLEQERPEPRVPGRRARADPLRPGQAREAAGQIRN